MITLAVYIRESLEVHRRHVPPISEAILGSGGNEKSYISTKETKVSTLRGPAQLADLLGALCVPHLQFSMYLQQTTISKFIGRDFFVFPAWVCEGVYISPQPRELRKKKDRVHICVVLL